MELNWTIEVFIELIGSIPMLISFYILNKEYKKINDRVLLFLQIGWLSFSLAFIMDAASYLFLSKTLFILKNIPVIILALSIEIAMNLINREKIDPIRFSFISFISIFTLYVSTEENSIIDFTWPNGDKSFAAVGIYRLMFTLTVWWVVFSYSIYAFKIYLNSPPKLKNPAKYNLIGVLILAPIAFFVFALKINWIIPGAQAIVIGIGALVSTYYIGKYPQLLYVLPYDVYKLIVVESGSGLMLYAHNWIEEQLSVSTPLFATTYEGLSIFIKDSMKLGNINEILLDNGTIIIRHIEQTELYVVLLASKSTYSLRRGLDCFTKRFSSEFKHLLNSDPVILQNEFRLSNIIIDQCFPYVPKS